LHTGAIATRIMKICQARTTDSQHRHTDSHQGFGSALKFTIQFHAMFLNVVYVVKSDVQIRAAIGSQSTNSDIQHNQ